MPRFVILTHDHPQLHWDLLLEAGAACRTWRLLEEPGPERTVPAEAIAAHRLHYLDYEGPVGGNRGNVARWDAGTFQWIADEPGRVEIKLTGRLLQGRCTIVCCDATSNYACVFAAHSSNRVACRIVPRKRKR